MKIGLISDTHGFLDEKVKKYFVYCDEIWHAGDIGNLEVSKQLSEIAPFKAVYGNIDSSEIRHQFPETLNFECEQKKICIHHIGGTPPSYNKISKQIILENKPDIFICGHSHILKVTMDPKMNLLYINPGAAGNHGFHKMKTIITFEILAGEIKNMKVVELGKRGFE
jgi:putative phosphoesterase